MNGTRVRVQHKEYGWVGDIQNRTHPSWYRIAWDNGKTTTEHIEDIEVRETAK